MSSASGVIGEAGETTPADLQNAPRELLGRQVEGVAGERLAVELDGALGDQAPGLAAARAEGSGDQGRQVDRAAPELDGRDVVGDLVADVDLVETRLGGLARPRRMEAVDDPPGEL